MKTVIETLEDVPEILRGEYELKDGKYVLKLDAPPPGFVAQSEAAAATASAAAKLAEFRDNNRALNMLRDQLEQKLKGYDGVDPIRARELEQKVKELEQRGVKGTDDIALLVQRAVMAATEPLTKQVNDITAAKEAADRQVALSSVRQELLGVASKVGVAEKAVPDYVHRGEGLWQYVEGKVVAMGTDGQPILSRKNPANLLSVEEWALDLQNEAPHLFIQSRGGGATQSVFGPSAARVAAKRTIGSDPMEFGKNLEGIASGAVIVRD